MRILRCSDHDFNQTLDELASRPPVAAEIEAGVARILARVQSDGDAAVVDFARQFDGVVLSPERFRVTPQELAAARRQLPPALARHIRQAHRQIRQFSRNRIPKTWRQSPRPGVTVGERFVPLSRVACYVPGGTAPLISTVLHTVTLAKVAGVPDVIVLTPPGRGDGVVDPAILDAATVAGASSVYRLGGVYGIAAAAYGTATVPAVEKIVGPGNAYVTAAKRQVYGRVSIDMIAGPSEVMVIADGTARPDFIAADMLSQIEHGSGFERAYLVTTNESLVAPVQAAIEAQAAILPREATVRKCLERGVLAIVVPDLATAAQIANRIAPEHLEIMTASPAAVARRVKAAGAIFLGPWTPEPVGDFVAGPSHVLPTGGTARFFSGLTVEQFLRRISVVHYRRSALAREVGMVKGFADAEGLAAHGRSATIRFEIDDDAGRAGR